MLKIELQQELENYKRREKHIKDFIAHELHQSILDLNPCSDGIEIYNNLRNKVGLDPLIEEEQIFTITIPKGNIEVLINDINVEIKGILGEDIELNYG